MILQLMNLYLKKFYPQKFEGFYAEITNTFLDDSSLGLLARMIVKKVMKN